MASRFAGRPANLRLKRAHKKLGGSSTPGRSKGWNCQAGPRDRTLARRNRSYRSKSYAEWDMRHTGKKEPGKA